MSAFECGNTTTNAAFESEDLCHRFSLFEIQRATNNFDDALVIGKSGFGVVHKGFIDNGATTVTIKRLHTESKRGAEEFWTKIKTLSNLRHVHLVTLIGYSNDYEEMSLNICIGAALGLDYHHTNTKQSVIHRDRDVKTTNILLDENLVVKISDFELSKISTTNHTHINCLLPPNLTPSHQRRPPSLSSLAAHRHRHRHRRKSPPSPAPAYKFSLDLSLSRRSMQPRSLSKGSDATSSAPSQN
ncbi:hypothetical protein ACSBR2_010247 [Camellia fascicularis]